MGSRSVWGLGWQGVRTPGKIPKWLLKVSLEMLVGTPDEKQLDLSGPIASRGRFVRPSAKKVHALTCA